MTRSIVKAVVCGVIVGVLAFFVPHLLIGLVIICLIAGAFHCCAHRHGCCGHGHHERMFYLADKIRKMSEEEYEEFKTKMGGGCCDNGHYGHGSCCGGSKSDNDGCCESKKETK